MATTKPGVQKPHCWASCLTKAAGTASSLPPSDERLGRLDRLALGFQGEHGAGIDRLAVERDRAGPAGAAIADALAAGDVEVIAQGVEQRDARLDRGGHFGAVDVERELDGPWADGDGVGVGGLGDGHGSPGQSGRGRRGGAGTSRKSRRDRPPGVRP